MAAAAPAPVAPKAAPPRLPSLSAPLPSPGAPEEPAAERPPPVAPPPQVPVAPATPLAPPASPPRAPPGEVRPPSPARLDVTSDARILPIAPREPLPFQSAGSGAAAAALPPTPALVGARPSSAPPAAGPGAAPPGALLGVTVEGTMLSPFVNNPLPFLGAKGPAISAPGAASPPERALAAATPATPATPLPALPSTPASPAARQSGARWTTAPVNIVTEDLPPLPRQDPLPFRAPGQVAPSTAASGTERPSAEPGGLAEAAAVARPSASAAIPQLTLEQHASLCAEIAAFPHNAEQCFARYGLASEPVRRAVDAAWNQRLRQSPDEYERWKQLYHWQSQRLRAR